MPHPALLERFQRCLEYKQASSWRKPFINPSRFLANQLRTRKKSSLPPGSTRRTSVFHQNDFTVVEGEGVSCEIESYGVFEEALTEAFLRLIHPGQTVVDIGMHLGYYTSLFATLVNESGAVHAFEPTPSTRLLALNNVGRFPHVTVHSEAVWSDVGILDFRDYGVGWMAFNSFTNAKSSDVPAPVVFQVHTITLDVFRRSISRPVALIKVDAESAESRILVGAEQTLLTDQPLVTLEMGDTEGSVESRALVDLMAAKGYAPWEFVSGRFNHHTPRRTYGYDNLIFAPQHRDLARE